MATLLETLKTKLLVADGAIGTLLYSHGLNQCYEAYNLSHPEEIKSIHQAYIDSGADIIQTNTYGAKRSRLKTYGFGDDVHAINLAGAKLAREVAGDGTFVLGTIGATRGLKQCNLSLQEIIEETLEQVHALLASEVIDGLLFETYYDTDELLAVLKRVRPLTRLPILTNVSLHEPGIVANGSPLVEIFSQLVVNGADVIGLNCHLGPHHMIKSLEQVPLFAETYLAVYPNASLLSIVDDGSKSSYGFSDNASYFGDSAKALVQEGARIIGGCCGTTPKHIKAVKKAIRHLKPIDKKVVNVSNNLTDSVIKTPSKETIVDRVKKETTIIVEIDPPKTLDIENFKKAVHTIDDCQIEAITLADNSLAKTRICNLSMASLLKDEIDTPFLLHLACRDHNLIGLQSRLLGMDVLGIDNILAVSGDPSKIGDFPGATSVYDVTSFKLIDLIKTLNKGQGYSGANLKRQTNFTVAAAFNPNIRNLSRSNRLIEKKISAGADYFITQPIFEESIIEGLAQLTEPYYQPFFVGIMPITSYQNAIFLHNEVPGINLSESFLSKLEKIKDDKKACQKLALDESKKLIDKAMVHFKGIYLITPFLRTDLITELIDYIKNK
ncbi:MAG: bifunctional homocysteine S-methyltransferase/methylenetetrahydrofolate reductase [Streptococcus sp.]|nr:bifunctional homocysteine S-methyltransferase/methylenetetrahydrofolate reductase [Streptococcus sp.]